MNLTFIREWYNHLPDDLELEVTAKDIHDGIRIHCQKCPLALAAKRLLSAYPMPDGRLNVTVSGSSVNIYCDDWFTGRFWFDQSGDKFIARFDTGKKVKPGTFLLHKPGKGPRS